MPTVLRILRGECVHTLVNMVVYVERVDDETSPGYHILKMR
jgi:hypothetical protein